MSDIAFLLIIFFMVTSVFTLKDGLHLTLPDKNKKPVMVATKNVLTIGVEGEGQLKLNDKPIMREKLEERIREEMRSNPEVFVLLKISSRVRYDLAVDVIDTVKYSGIKKLTIRMAEK